MRKLLILFALLLLAAPATQAQTTTAFKTGEQTTGTTKQCYYEALGAEHTRTVSSITLCPLTIEVRSSPSVPRTPETPRVPSSGTGTAYKTGERTTGTTKQCFYNYLGSDYTKTVQSIELCPLSITVRPY